MNHKTRIFIISILLPLRLITAENDTPIKPEPATVLVIQGAGGEQKYDRQFSESASKLAKIAQDNAHVVRVIGSDHERTQGQAAVRDQLIRTLNEEAGRASPLWIVFFGHGTFDGKQAKFNLKGPDISASELKQWLAGFERPIAIVNCSSASAPFINALSGQDRVVITATKSGFEMNATQFGDLFVDALSDLSADLDKDQQVSLLEAFLVTSARVTEFYESDGRLAAEHSLIDDNGDLLGTPSDWFKGIRVVRKSNSKTALPDGFRAHQWHLVPSEREKTLPFEMKKRRDDIELKIELLRVKKSGLDPDEYYQSLESLMMELGEIYETANK